MPGKGSLPDQTEKSLKRRSTLNLFRGNPSHDIRSTTRSSARTNLSKRALSEDGPRRPLRITSNSIDSNRSPSPTSPLPILRTPRFSLMRFRHASDPQLATRARQHADMDIPPLPAMPTGTQRTRRSNSTDHMTAPTVMITAPTIDGALMPPTTRHDRRTSRIGPFSRPKQFEGPMPLEAQSARPSLEVRRKAENRKSRFATFGRSRDPADELRRLAGSRIAAPVADSLVSGVGQSGGSSLTLPMGRTSEASKSEVGWGPSEHMPHSPERPKAYSNSSFTWLSRRNKHRSSLFPRPAYVEHPSDSHPSTEPQTPRASTSARSTNTVDDSPSRASPARRARMAYNTHEVYDMASHSTSAALAAASIHFAGPGGALFRTSSSQSLRSAHSSPALAIPPGVQRTRSSTMGSGFSEDMHPPTPPLVNGSARNSTSTAGRSSFSNLFHLSHRFRHGSDPHSPRQGSPGYGSGTPGLESQSNSLSMSRELAVLPDREEGETAMQYLARVEAVVPKSQIPSILSKKTEEYYHSVMRSFMRKSAFFGDPLDMALRKLLMEIDLPKETQQIDRVLQSFADRYHECNPGVFPDPDKAYYMTFSLLLLQSDAFNKSNKRKMAKPDYVKNSSTDGVSDDVLECFYDNIVYTPFIRVEDEIDMKTMSSRRSKKTKKILKDAVDAVEPARKATKEPLDPYTLILENKLDVLRPPLRGVISVDDPYSYLGTAPSFDKRLLRGMKCGNIQLESSRSRPDAFKSQSGIDNPDEANIGIIDLPVEKVGVLWRKDPKKRTARSPWQEWGAILTGAGLYFFKNSHFVKNFINQFEEHLKHGDGGQLTFKPTIQNWKADYTMPTENGVALHDSIYKKHKNAFVFFRHSNAEEVFLADNEAEMNDWLMKLNYQAAFKTYGIRTRGLLGGNYEGQRQRGIRRLESSTSTTTLQTVQTPTGEVTIQSGKIDRQLAEDISASRRETMQLKITELEDKLEELIKTERGQRRDATHLFVLAPIQEKTRNALMHAASRVSARLKWSRIEIWRIKCHRDILAMDLEEEKNPTQRRLHQSERLVVSAPKATSIASQSTNSTAKPRANGAERLNSNATASSTLSPAKSGQSHGSILRPDTRASQRSVSQRSSIITTDEDVFQTPPERTPSSSPIVASAPSMTPSSAKKTPFAHRGSITSTASPSLLSQRGTVSAEDFQDSPTASEFCTPILTDAEAEHRRVGVLGPNPEGLDGVPPEWPGTSTSNEPEPNKEPSDFAFTGSPDSRKQIRRSLQRTLRDSARMGSPNGIHHRHSRSGMHDSNSSAVVPEDALVDSSTLAPGEGLKRHQASFTVHGKKASVITFGGDWANIDPGERLKVLARNESQKGAERLGGNHSMEETDNDEFTIAPRRSSVSLKERRAFSHGIGAGDGLGTANSLRKFSTSSGPPVFDRTAFEQAGKGRVNGATTSGMESSDDEDRMETPKAKPAFVAVES